MRRTDSRQKSRDYLGNLTKEELVELILKFAPQSFIDAINQQFISEREATKIFKAASKSTLKLFKDEELLWDPSEFERQLAQELETVRGLWNKLPVEIGDLIIKVIEKIEESFEEGYLYIERYDRADEYVEAEEVNDYIISFVNSLPNDLRSNYVPELKNVLDQAGYGTFSDVLDALKAIS